MKATFIEPVLGTWPANPNVAREFIASKSPDAATIEDEVAALGPDAVADKGMTVFPRDPDGNPIFYDYQIKGMFKDACGMLSRIGGKTETGKKKAVNESGKLTAYKKVIDGLIFVQPRMIPIHVNGEITECQRPLRAQTAQGERVSLTNSEQIPAGLTCEFDVILLDDSHGKELHFGLYNDGFVKDFGGLTVLDFEIDEIEKNGVAKTLTAWTVKEEQA